MNGPKHYQMAEGLLVEALAAAKTGDDAFAAMAHAAAQVHATLALAAATALAIDPTPEAVAVWDPLVLEGKDGDPVGEPVRACGRPMNPFQDEPVCVLEHGHEDYHADGHGNRWTT